VGEGLRDHASVPRRGRRLISVPEHTAAPRGRAARWEGPAFALAVAALIVYTSFNAGGFFAGTPAAGAALLAVVLMLRLTVAEEPLAGIGARLFVPIGALALYAVWVLVSAAWSHAPGRATIEFDRALFYLLVLVLFGSWPSSPARSRWLIRGVALAFVSVCAVALVSRLLPDVLHTNPNLHNERLSYPLTYWNALGLMAAIAVPLCLHLAGSIEEPPFVRVLGAGALPVACTVLYFTFSRGAIAAAVIAVVVFVVLGRSRSLPLGLIASAPAVAIAVSVAYGAELLARPDLTGAATSKQGHHVAVVVAACVAGAAVLRAALCLVERRIAALVLPRQGTRGARLAGWGSFVVVLVLAAALLDVPSRVDHAVKQFGRSALADQAVSRDRDLRARLGTASNNGRTDIWRVSIDSFEAHPLLGKGAGTFQTQWLQKRPYPDRVNDGHSLYIETLGELGLVGGVLMLALVLSVLSGLAARARGADRAVGAALFVAALAWALDAGIDWDWEMPAVTLWMFAAAGTLLSAPVRAEGAAPRVRAVPRLGRRTRVLCGIACLVVAVTPVRVVLSQGELNKSVSAYKRGDCSGAVDGALSSISAFGERPDPYEIVAYCDLQARRPDLGLPLMKQAVSLDPNDSELRYGLSLMRAGTGQDPRPEARAALRLDPLSTRARDAVRRFATSSPRNWERGAQTAPLSLSP
jgi:O-antigen ligase